MIITNYPSFDHLKDLYFTLILAGFFQLGGEFSGCSDFLQQIKDANPLSSGWHGAYWDT